MGPLRMLARLRPHSFPALAVACVAPILGACVEDPPEVELTCRYHLTTGPGAREVTLRVQVPVSIADVQRVTRLAIEPEPHAFVDGDGFRVAQWTFAEPPKHLRVTVRAGIAFEDDAHSEAMDAIEARDRASSARIAPEVHLEHDAPEIRALADRLDGATLGARVESAVALVAGALSYDGYVGETLGALRALREGRGDCTEHADLLVALLRADGVAARGVRGIQGLVPGRKDATPHSWALIAGEGRWHRVDPLEARLAGDVSVNGQGVYVAFTTARNEPAWDWWRVDLGAGEASVSWESELARLTP